MFLEGKPAQVVPVSSGGQDILASVIPLLNSERSGYPSHIDTELCVKFLIGLLISTHCTRPLTKDPATISIRILGDTF